MQLMACIEMWEIWQGRKMRKCNQWTASKSCGTVQSPFCTDHLLSSLSTRALSKTSLVLTKGFPKSCCTFQKEMLFPLCPAPKAIEFCFSLLFYMNQNEKNHFLKMGSILISQEKSWKAVHLCSGHLISVSSPQKSYKTQFLREGFLLKMMI